MVLNILTNMKKSKIALFVLIPFVLSACEENPAEQCLESFRMDLVSPNSAKVLRLEGNKLSYLAKNRNGVEVQGKAICKEFNKTWARDTAEEYIEILKYHNASMEANNDCRVRFEDKSYCSINHPVISLDVARIRLGYN